MNTLKWREQIIQPSENEIIKNNIFDMALCLTKFKSHYAERIFDVILRVGGG